MSYRLEVKEAVGQKRNYDGKLRESFVFAGCEHSERPGIASRSENLRWALKDPPVPSDHLCSHWTLGGLLYYLCIC
jgi:hypothetical protein